MIVSRRRVCERFDAVAHLEAPGRRLPVFTRVGDQCKVAPSRRLFDGEAAEIALDALQARAQEQEHTRVEQVLDHLTGLRMLAHRRLALRRSNTYCLRLVESAERLKDEELPAGSHLPSRGASPSRVDAASGIWKGA